MQFSVGSAHLQGRVRWAVLNADGSFADGGTLEPDKPSSNLILDQGIDNLDSNELASLFQNCAVGVGTSTPDATQTELDNEKARTNNYVKDLCGTTFPADHSSPYTVVLKRGFDFPQGSLDSSTDGDYTELGFSQSSSAGQNLFSRALIKDESGNTISVTVASDQILRIAYELDLTLAPSAKTSGSFDITNIGTINFESLGGSANNDFSTVNSDGTVNNKTRSTFDPSKVSGGFGFGNHVCEITSDDSSFHSGFVTGSVNTAPALGDFTNDPTVTYQGNGVWQYECTFATDQGNITGVKNIRLGVNDSNNTDFTVRFRVNDGDEFNKESTHELVLTFEISFTYN